jgi:hypothetical protein
MAKKKARTSTIVRKVVRGARDSPGQMQRRVGEVAQRAETLMTPAAGASAAAASALGSALGARIVASGRLTPKQTGAALALAGSATSYIGYRQKSPVIFGAGVGTGISGVSLLTTNLVLERRERQQRRNAVLLMPYDDDRDNEEGDMDEERFV